jgi:hypothetical protein
MLPDANSVRGLVTSYQRVSEAGNPANRYRALAAEAKSTYGRTSDLENYTRRSEAGYASAPPKTSLAKSIEDIVDVPTTSRPTAGTLVSAAVSAAEAIVGYLKEARAVAQQAADNFSPGNDVSGYQAQLVNLRRQIDLEVDYSTVENRNLLSSGYLGTDVEVQSSNGGGKIKIKAQPLDSRALGLYSLDVSSESSAQRTLDAIDSALATAKVRRDSLASAQRANDLQGGFVDKVVRVAGSTLSNYFNIRRTDVETQTQLQQQTTAQRLTQIDTRTATQVSLPRGSIVSILA